uniref:Uncharacterized protein n=1 Tax=Timema shepardi TaxID=629360 RepID=A0A7R9B282_TIMSH|nr:unnamed protein product [Timema shepardi]
MGVRKDSARTCEIFAENARLPLREVSAEIPPVCTEPKSRSNDKTDPPHYRAGHPVSELAANGTWLLSLPAFKYSFQTRILVVLIANSDGNTAFLRAARAGHLDKVLEHLKANIDINTSNSVSKHLN